MWREHGGTQQTSFELLIFSFFCLGPNGRCQTTGVRDSGVLKVNRKVQEPNRTRRNRTEPLQRTARNRPVTEPSPPYVLYSLALPAARGRVQVFGTFRPKPVLRPSTPNPAAQHPQPCLLLLRRSNECRFPSHRTETAHALYSPALPRAHGGVQVSALSSPKRSKTCTPPRPRASMNRGAGRNYEPNRSEPPSGPYRFKRTQPNRNFTELRNRPLFSDIPTCAENVRVHAQAKS